MPAFSSSPRDPSSSVERLDAERLHLGKLSSFPFLLSSAKPTVASPSASVNCHWRHESAYLAVSDRDLQYISSKWASPHFSQCHFEHAGLTATCLATVLVKEFLMLLHYDGQNHRLLIKSMHLLFHNYLPIVAFLLRIFLKHELPIPSLLPSPSEKGKEGKRVTSLGRDSDR